MLFDAYYMRFIRRNLQHFLTFTQKLCTHKIFRISFRNFCGPRRVFCPDSNLRLLNLPRHRGPWCELLSSRADQPAAAGDPLLNSPHHRGPWCELLSSRADQPAAARDPPAGPGQPIS